MKVEKNGNYLEISFAYNPQLVSWMKTFENRVFDARRRVWLLPLAGSRDALKRLAARGFTIMPEVELELNLDASRAREAERIAMLSTIEIDSPLPLFPYQKVGVAFLSTIGSGLLGDEMGLGKTVQALGVCEEVEAQKVLVFAPSAVKWQWAGEIEKFIPGASIAVIEGAVDKRVEMWKKEARFYVVNYELLLRDFGMISARVWDIIIADEATKISNPTTKQSKAIKKLRAKRRIAMTGTPVSNRANEIWNIIDFCQPGAFGNYWAFLNRYCLKNRLGGIFGYQNMDELGNRLKRYMIRRLKKEVLPDLPAKIVTDIPFDMSNKELALYRNIKKEILFEIEKQDISKLHTPMSIQYTLVKMLRLRQLADSMELLGQNVQSSKMEVLCELLEENVQNGRKAIVFTGFSQMADIIERELMVCGYSPLKISGSIKEEYHEVVRKFNEIEEHKVLVMTSAGQFGLNIQRASVIFHYDQEWSLAKMEQREGRAHRYGQKDTVLVYNLLARGTVDEYVKRILFDKKKLAESILMDDVMAMLRHGD